MLIDAIRKDFPSKIVAFVAKLYRTHFNREISTAICAELEDRLHDLSYIGRETGDIDEWKKIRDIFIELDI